MEDRRDWLESEPPLTRAVIEELQRLKRRAQARPFTVFFVATALTAGLLAMIAYRATTVRARIIIAVTEGDLTATYTPASMSELREYIGSVLLPNAALMPIIDDHPEEFPLRKRLGDNFALSELRDMIDIEVWRNYFLYGYSEDQRRSARIAISVIHPDPGFAIYLARRLTRLVIDREAERRRAAADLLAADTADIVARAHAQVSAAENAHNARAVALAQAELAGDRDRAVALRGDVAALADQLYHAREEFDNVRHEASVDQLDAAITRAGLGLGLAVADEQLPPPVDGNRPMALVVIALILFSIMVPVTAIVIGAFDSRIHDGDDVRRLGLPVVGHVPGFSGDGLGSLRDRGVRRRRVPSF